MPIHPKFDQFFEAKDKPPKKAKVSVDVPPQGKNAAPYHAPHAKNDDKPKLRVVEKPDHALGDEATPSLKDPEKNLPHGKKPSKDVMTVEEYVRARGEYDGKVRIRVAEKTGKGLGDEASPQMTNPKDAHPLGEKPDHKHLTTESFVRETSDLSNEEFIHQMLTESKKNDDDDDDEKDDFGVMRCVRTGRSVVPSAFEVANYMARVLPINERALRSFVREVVETEGALPALMGELTAHSSTYMELVNQMGQTDSPVPGGMVRAMRDSRESFLSELGLQSGQFGVSEGVSEPTKQRFGDEDDEPQGDPKPGGEEQSAEVTPEMATPELDPANPAAPDVPPVGQNATPAQEAAYQLNKEFAYHHMLKEMGKHTYMRDVMTDVMSNY